MGGTLPTCTDANVLLGYLNPDFFAGGAIKLDVEKTRELTNKQLANKLELSLLETAVGMFRVINNNMAQGVRAVSVERGYDPREFLFIVAGGAGPIHAGEICQELEIPMFLVPSVASIFCAAGMLLGDLKHDYIRSYITPFSAIDKRYFLEIFEQLKIMGVDTLKKEGVKEESIEFHPVLDLRYIGQYHEVPLSADWEDIIRYDLETVCQAFHKEHNRLYGYSLEEEGTEIELINVRLRAIGKSVKPKFLTSRMEPVPLETALKGKRLAYIPESNRMEEVPVYDGDAPLYGHLITGPALIEKVNTSIFVSAIYDCKVDNYGSFVVFDRKKFSYAG
jgi:N-methylhydantoinase A